MHILDDGTGVATARRRVVRRKSHVVLLEQQALIAGGQVVLLELVEAYLKGGARVTVAVPIEQGLLARRIRQRFGRRAELVFVPAPLQPDPVAHSMSWGQVTRMNRTIRRILRVLPKVDVLHVNGSRWFPYMGMIAETVRPGAVIYHYHIAHPPADVETLRRLLRVQSNACVLTASPFLQTHARTRLSDCPASRIVQADNPLPRPFRQLGWRDRTELSGGLGVAVIGRVCPEKGHGLLPELARRLPSVTFHVVGPVERRNMAFAVRLQRDCPGNVVFWPPTTDVPAWVERTGVSVSLVLSHRAEGFGLVFIESMSLSLISLCAPNGALSELAARAGGLVFSNVDEAVDQIETVRQMDVAKRLALSRRQYDAAMHDFAFPRFAITVCRALKALR